MKTYELTYIISSQMSPKEADELAKETESAIQTKEGVILKSAKIAAKPLAYPIKKNSSGYFAVVEFQGQENIIKELKESLDRNKSILRSFVAVKKPVKIMKERRTRKPLLKVVADSIAGLSPYKKAGGADKSGKAGMEDIDKKLDEILSE